MNTKALVCLVFFGMMSSVAQAADTKDSVLQTYALEIKGIKKFDDLSRIENELKASLPEGARYFEKEMSRGRVQLEIQVSISERELQILLAQTGAKLSSGGLKMKVSPTETKPFLMEIEP